MNEITIKLSLDNLNRVMAALGKLPLESTVDVWADIKGQAEAQIKAVNDEVAANKALLAETQAKLKAMETKILDTHANERTLQT